MLPCVWIDYGIGLLIEFGEILVPAAFAFLDDFVEAGVHYEFDFFCLLFFFDRHYLAEGFFPLSMGVDVCVGLDGADDGVGGDFGDGGALDDVFEGGADVPGAGQVELHGTSVTVEGGAVAEAELFDDGAGVAPIDEGLVDFLALGVVTDLAEAGVDFGIGDGCFCFW